MDELTQALRRSGLRLTPQRQLVLAAVRALHHATPDDVAAEVQKTSAGVSLSTVYRTLELLEELGLVTHTHLGHGSPRYHARDDHEHPHLHLVCRDCGRVTEADAALADGLADGLRSEHGFEVDVGHLAFFGRCAACTAALDPS